MNKLNVDEVMALQMSGLPIRTILRTDIDAFDQLYNNHPELEDYINRANELLDRQEEMGIVSISCQDANFPSRLIAIEDDCPTVIYCKGNLELLKSSKAVAIIGARSADREGCMKAYQLSKKYAEDGYVVVSGLALGCDTAAHRGCLDADGNTIAIVGSGLNITHPRENKWLEDLILTKGGLLLSEQVIGVKANPSHLIARNRLQAALAEFVILAQCPIQSGSLHTMRFARKYRKPSFAATFPRQTSANAGNYSLIAEKYANPI